MARDSRQSHISKPGSFEPLESESAWWTQTLLLMILGGALAWVWWRYRLEAIWRRPQHAPLSAQWLTTNWADHASLQP